MPAERDTVLCHYHYDPLDRLVSCTRPKHAGLQRFYCKSRLATEIQGQIKWTVFQYNNQLLAQQKCQDSVVETSLLGTDQQRTILQFLDGAETQRLRYTAYGHRSGGSGLSSLLGFNGERPDPITGHYLLGNGYRAFNPVLMRFNSPDSWSPFGRGGLNPYMYCSGDPVNFGDRTGHMRLSAITGFFRKLWPKASKPATATPVRQTLGSGNFKNPLANVKTNNVSSSINHLPKSEVDQYASIGASSSNSSISSSHPSIKSNYTDIPMGPPTLPSRSPPSSVYRASVPPGGAPDLMDRISTGMPEDRVSQWVGSVSSNPEDLTFAQIPRAGAPQIENAAIQFAGEKIAKNIRANYHTYQQYGFPISPEDLRTQYRDRYMARHPNR